MIKFRVWDKEHKRMLNIETLALSFSPKGVLTSIYTYGPDFSNDPEIIGDDKPDLDSVILEQFTGLKDVNGKEIYEGDILRTKAGLIQIVEQGILEADREDIINGFYANNLSDEKPHTFSYDDEVIGNVHENPELSEG